MTQLPAGVMREALIDVGAITANTRHLREVCEDQGVRAYQVEGPDEVVAAWLEGAGRVGLTAGASTPDYSVDEVEARIRQLAR